MGGPETAGKTKAGVGPFAICVNSIAPGGARVS
jgi:hypothetical protein